MSALQSRLLTLSPYPHLRPHDSDPVLTNAQSSPQPTATPYPAVQPPTPTPSILLDLELQEAFQECEEQMASLGIFNPTQPPGNTPELANDGGKKTGEVMVKSSESSSLPPIVVQQGHSNGGHGNKSTHGNSEAANSQKGTVVFSFRNYILGTENSALAAETQSEIKATLSLDKCPEITPEKETQIHEEKETPPHIQLQIATNADSFKEAPENALSELRQDEKRYVVSNATTEEALDCNTVIREKDTETITKLVDKKKENYSDECSSTVCIVESEKKDSSVDETLGCSNLHLKDKDALSKLQSEAQTVTGRYTEENQSESKTDKQTNSASDKQAEQDKETKKKDKKKARKKKMMERSGDNEQKAKTVIQSENYLQRERVRSASVHTDSEAGVGSVSQTDTLTVICGKQFESGFDYKQQLSPQGKPSSTSPLSSSYSRQDHFTDSACSPASKEALSQRPNQSDNHNHTDAPCDMKHSSDGSPQQEQHVTRGVINNQNTSKTSVQTAVINRAAFAGLLDDERSDSQMQEAIVTTEAVMLTQENLSPLTNSQTCVGESCMESALEEGLVVVAALPLTTPTMPEVIESKGEGESVRRDSFESVATVAIAESEKALGEKDLGGTAKCLSSLDEEREGLLDSLSPLSLICSLTFSAKEGQAVFENSCSSKMPHNSAETEVKGVRETTVCSADTEISPAEEGDREKEPLRLEAYINTSPLGLLTGPDYQNQSAAGLEGGGEGGGGGEEVEKKGGLATEHSSFSQPEGSASGVSSAETETCPPINVAESQLKSQSRSEPIATITESFCTEQDRLSHPCQEQHGAAILPLPTQLEQSSSNINGGVRNDLQSNLISEKALSLGTTCQESSIAETERNNSQVFLSSNSPQPLTTSQQIPVEQQASNVQQVQPESSTTEAGTTISAAEFQIQTQTQSNSSSPAMSGVGVYTCDSSSANNRVHFEDTVKQEDSSSVDHKNMSAPAMDCASLPPLTVHESLHHPVVEASYIFPDFLSPKRSEIPTNAASTKTEPAMQSSADFPKTQKDVQLDREDLETKDTKDNIAIDSDNLLTNVLDLQLVTEACTKQLSCPTEKNQTGNEDSFDLLQAAGNAISEAKHLTFEQVSAKMIKQEEAETEKCRVNMCLTKETELDVLNAESKGSIKNDQSQDSPLVSNSPGIFEEEEGNQRPVSSHSVLPADNTCKPLSDVPTELPLGYLSAHVDSSSKPETVTLTCTASLQTKSSDNSCQPPTQLDQEPPCGLVSTDPTKAKEEPRSTIHFTDLTKDESVTSEVTASDQSIPIIKQYASNPTFVLQPPGPMLSHLEFITDCISIPLPEQLDKGSADGDSTKVSEERDSNKSREMSLAQDLEHGDVSVEADRVCPKLEEDNYATESVAELENNVNIPSPQEQNLSPLTQPPTAVGVLAKGESDNVISMPQTEPDYIDIKSVISEASIRDDLINVSCSVNSAKPTNKPYDEIKVDNMKERHKMGDRASELFEEEKKQVEGTTMNNQKETANSRKLQTGKTGTTPQHSNGLDKEAMEEIGDLRSPHKHKDQKTELPMREIKEEGERKSASSDKPAGSSKDMLSAEVKSVIESQTVYNQSLCQTPTATLESSSDRDTAPDLSTALGQSQSTTDRNSFAQEQEQKQQCLESNGLESQDRQTQALVPGIEGLVEEEDSSVGCLCHSEIRDELTSDCSRGNERVIELEKGDGEEAVSGADMVYVPPHLASDIEIVTACSHVRETREGMDENKSPGLRVVGSDTGLMPGTEFESDVCGKGLQKDKDQHRKPETSADTGVSVESASQEHETSPFEISVSSKVSTDSQGIHIEVIPSANQGEEQATKAAKIFTVLPDSVGQPESVEKDFSAATAVKSNSNETEECEIQDTVCDPLELQSSNKTSATQSSPVVQTPIKGPEVEEITKEAKAALKQWKACDQGNGQGEIKATNNEAIEKQGVVNLTGSAKDSDSGSFKTADLCEIGVSHGSTHPTVCLSGGSICLSKATESDSYTTDKIIPDVSSTCLEDFASTPLAAPTHSEKPYDQVSLSKPLDDTVVNLIVAASQCELKSLETAPACISPVEHVSVNKEASDLSESPAPTQTAQEPDTNWIQALRKAASHSQSEQVNTGETSR